MVEERRVSELHYEIRCLTPDTQLRSPITTLELAGIPCIIQGDTLIARPRADRSSDLASVSADLQAALRNWALELELTQGRPVVFRPSTTVWHEAPSQAPPPPGAPAPVQLSVDITSQVSMSGSLSMTVNAPLPPPTGTIASTPEVELWLQRLRQVKDGHEFASVAAYALLTYLQTSYGGGKRAPAAAALHVSRGLLDQVGALASGYHPTKGRKTERRQQVLTDADLVWLERAMALLVRRLAELAAAPAALSELTVADVS